MDKLLRFFLLSLCTLVVVPLSVPPTSAVSSLDPAPAYELRFGAIQIHSNAEFTEENGVTDGNGTWHDPFIIEGWEIYSPLSHSIDIRSTDAHFVIRDVYIRQPFRSEDAIHFVSVQNGTILNSRLEEARTGVAVFDSINVTVANNVIFHNGDGISLFTSQRVTLQGNEFLGGGLYLTGGESSHFEHTITEDNLVNGKPLIYRANCEGVTVENAPVGQLVIAGCSDIRITGLTIEGTNVGLHLTHVEDVYIASNILRANGFGIRLFNARDVLIELNQLTGNWNGIRLTRAEIVTLRDTVLTGPEDPPALYHRGLFVAGVKNLNVYRNDFATWAGEFRLLGSELARIYHNNFTGTVEAGNNKATQWDDGYPSGGNRWANYEGEDRCGGPQQDICPNPDGIGDTPHLILGEYGRGGDGSKDRYPLVSPPSERPNSPPTASFVVSPETGDVTTTFAVDASTSYDVEDRVEDLWVRWDWESDGDWDTSWSGVKTAEHRYAEPGVYHIRLEVLDSNGSSDLSTTALEVRLYAPLALVSHPVKPFRLMIPMTWEVEWDHERDDSDTVDLLALGPRDRGYRPNLMVDSERASVEETDEFLMEMANVTFRAFRFSSASLVRHAPEIVQTDHSRAAYFIIDYIGPSLRQVVALFADESQGRIWMIVGITATATADLYEPILESVIESFEILEAPPPSPPSLTSFYLLLGIALAAVAFVWAELWLVQRKHRRRESSKGSP